MNKETDSDSVPTADAATVLKPCPFCGWLPQQLVGHTKRKFRCTNRDCCIYRISIDAAVWNRPSPTPPQVAGATSDEVGGSREEAPEWKCPKCGYGWAAHALITNECLALRKEAPEDAGLVERLRGGTDGCPCGDCELRREAASRIEALTGKEVGRG